MNYLLWERGPELCPLLGGCPFSEGPLLEVPLDTFCHHFCLIRAAWGGHGERIATLIIEVGDSNLVTLHLLTCFEAAILH